jgi:hypothetical protein
MCASAGDRACVLRQTIVDEPAAIGGHLFHSIAVLQFCNPG